MANDVENLSLFSIPTHLTIMSEGLTQPLRTINIVVLPRITPNPTSKITSPDYSHVMTDVAVGNC
jgi:hypothetical protein